MGGELPMSSEATRRPTAQAEYPHPVAFSVQLARNLVVQVLGIAMVALTGLSVLRWPAVLIWVVTVVAAIAAEHQCLRLVNRGARFSRAARIGAPALRVLITSIYAFAALVLIAKGGPGARLFAFALISAS